jgi:hypothetical protein
LLSPDTTYFDLKNYTLVEYDIVYTMVFFKKKNERFEIEFLELQIFGSMELELQTSALGFK